MYKTGVDLGSASDARVFLFLYNEIHTFKEQSGPSLIGVATLC